MSDDLSNFSMMDLFRMEAEERLSVLSQGLVALERGGATADLIESLMCAAHSLKGAARIVGLDAAVRVAHAMEDCLVAAQKGQMRLQSGPIDELLRGVDLLTHVSRVPEAELESWQHSHVEDVERFVSDLAAFQNGGPEPAPPATLTMSPVAAASQDPAISTLTLSHKQSYKGSGSHNRKGSHKHTGNYKGSGSRGLSRVQGFRETSLRRCQHLGPLSSPGASSAAAEPADRVVRVTAESLTRLMSLAGESLVQTRRFRPFVDSLLLLKSRQTGLLETLERLDDRLSREGVSLPPADREMLSSSRDQATALPAGSGRNARGDRRVRTQQRRAFRQAPSRGAHQPDASPS